MEFRIGGRRSGKTTAMLDWMEQAPPDEHRICVSASHERAMAVLRRSRDEQRPLESWQFVGVAELGVGLWAGVQYGRGGRIVLGLDDGEAILAQLIPWPVARLHATGELVAPSPSPRARRG